MADKYNIAKKIKKLRERLDLSQDRFGKKIGLTGKSISAYERGKCVPSLKILERISSIYDAGFLVLPRTYSQNVVKKLRSIKAVLADLEKNVLG